MSDFSEENRLISPEDDGDTVKITKLGLRFLDLPSK
jgi:hypothetical protein